MAFKNCSLKMSVEIWIRNNLWNVRICLKCCIISTLCVAPQGDVNQSWSRNAAEQQRSLGSASDRRALNKLPLGFLHASSVCAWVCPHPGADFLLQLKLPGDLEMKWCASQSSRSACSSSCHRWARLSLGYCWKGRANLLPPPMQAVCFCCRWS